MPEADIEARDGRGHTKLMWAVDACDAAMLRVLIASGANVRATNHKGTAAALLATWNKDPHCLDLLLRAGADIGARDSNFGFSLLMWAVENDDVQCLRVLLEHGADMEVTAQGETVTGLAQQRGKQ
eukprot:gene16295-19336_t